MIDVDNEGGRRAGRTALPLMDGWSISMDPPGGGRYWITEEMIPHDRKGHPKPVFRVAEVAKVFFARSPDWLRLPDKTTPLHLEGERLEIGRSDAGNRIFTLADVERLAHALLESDRIDAGQFLTTMNIVRWMAYAYKILTPAQMTPQTVAPAEAGEQLTIPGLEAAEGATVPACEACRAEDHAECAVACEIALRTGGVVVPGLHLTAQCACYAGAPERHHG